MNKMVCGKYKSCHDIGTLSEHCFSKNGEYKTYWRNGNLQEHYFYKNGELDGEYKYHNINGKLKIHNLYKDGKIERWIYTDNKSQVFCFRVIMWSVVVGLMLVVAAIIDYC